jgi:DNA-binding transcriptional ArsR family regulator
MKRHGNVSLMNESSVSEMNINDDTQSVEAMLTALGDPMRRKVFAFLRSCCCAVTVDEETGEARPVCSITVGEVCCAVPVAPATVSQHLKALREAGLIVTERDGKYIRCGVDPRALDRLAAYFSTDTNCC